MNVSEFTHATLPVVGKQVLRMAIAGNFGLSSSDLRWAAERGANYWLWGAGFKKVTEGLREILRTDREHHVVAYLGAGVFGWQVRRSVEDALRRLDTDYLDVFTLGWLGRTSRYAPGVIDALLELKREGKVRAIGASIHDRLRAGRLARDSEIDLFMIRYNAKHPGAEQDIFPHLSVRNPAVVCYTATAWRQLIREVRDTQMPPWPGERAVSVPPLTPELCYRFCLSSPHIHTVLTGPRDRDQLQQNLRALDAGPLEPEELEWVREYGRKVKAKRRLDYI